jgi:hypothetical protein
VKKADELVVCLRSLGDQYLRTERFRGGRLDAQAMPDGTLVITREEDGEECGVGLFAAGAWSHVLVEDSCAP